MIAIGIIFIPGFARYARSLTRARHARTLRRLCASTGVPVMRILLRDVLPNVAPGLLVQATVASATPSRSRRRCHFLGLGAQPPTPSWGNMIDDGRGFMGRAPHMIIAPALAILFRPLDQPARRGPATP